MIKHIVVFLFILLIFGIYREFRSTMMSTSHAVPLWLNRLLKRTPASNHSCYDLYGDQVVEGTIMQASESASEVRPIPSSDKQGQ